MSAAIIGWSHGRFGRHPEHDSESLMTEVIGAALADAGIEAETIDEVFVGMFNSGLSRQDFPSGLVLQAHPGLRYKPVTRVENACATGSAAVHLGARTVESGAAHHVLVVGVEKMTERPGREIGDILLRAGYVKEEADIPAGFAGVFGRIADAYFAHHGEQIDALARIATKNHFNGAGNPYAQFRKPLPLAFCRDISEDNPIVAGPLKRSDCSPISDGAAALVLASPEAARQAAKAIHFRARVHVTDYLPLSRRDASRLEGAAVAWQRAYAQAGIGLDDLDLVETHDCFTVAELMQYEAMGLTPVGEGRRAIEEGWTEKSGRLPVNPSGGLKSKGHPIGATGVSMHVLCAMQLHGSAGEMQVPGAALAGLFNMGGTGVVNYVSVLERAR